MPGYRFGHLALIQITPLRYRDIDGVDRPVAGGDGGQDGRVDPAAQRDRKGSAFGHVGLDAAVNVAIELAEKFVRAVPQEPVIVRFADHIECIVVAMQARLGVRAIDREEMPVRHRLDALEQGLMGQHVSVHAELEQGTLVDSCLAPQRQERLDLG